MYRKRTFNGIESVLDYAVCLGSAMSRRILCNVLKDIFQSFEFLWRLPDVLVGFLRLHSSQYTLKPHVPAGAKIGYISDTGD